MKILNALILSFLFFSSAKAQSSLYYTTDATVFFDSSENEKHRKLTKGECVIVDHPGLYKHRYLACTAIKDGQTGFLEVKKIKKERTYMGDTTGEKAVEVAKAQYVEPMVKLKNSCKKSYVNITFLGKKYELAPGEKVELFVKPPPSGRIRYKVEVGGYQPSYLNDTFEPYHIVESEFFE
jgi:hypothetical protein